MELISLTFTRTVLAPDKDTREWQMRPIWFEPQTRHTAAIWLGPRLRPGHTGKRKQLDERKHEARQADRHSKNSCMWPHAELVCSPGVCLFLARRATAACDTACSTRACAIWHGLALVVVDSA